MLPEASGPTTQTPLARLPEITFLAADDDFPTLLLGLLESAEHAFHRGRVHERPHQNSILQRIAEAHTPSRPVEHTTLPDQPVIMSPGRIDQNRERWIAEWASIVR